MVEPTEPTSGPPRRLAAGRVVCLAAVATAAGCAVAPKAKLDECHRVSQTLRAENNRLKDVALDLRAQNQDLSQRAVDDARRLAAQDEAVERLEQSVTAYQAEREALASAFEALKRQVRVAVNPSPAASRPDPLKAFAGSHPGWALDEASRSLSAEADRLFEPGRDRLADGSDEALKALAVALAEASAGGLAVEVAGLGGGPPAVRRAGFEPGSGGDEPADRFLAAARAARVRGRLAAAGLDPALVRLAPAPPDPAPDGPRRIAVRLTDAPPSSIPRPPTPMGRGPRNPSGSRDGGSRSGEGHEPIGPAGRP